MNTTKDKIKAMNTLSQGSRISSKNPNKYHSKIGSTKTMTIATPTFLHYRRQLSNQCKAEKDEWQHKVNQLSNMTTAPDSF